MLNLVLTRNTKQLQELFGDLKHPKDVADLLEVSYKDLVYWIYRTPIKSRYITFSVDKKNGGKRNISAPNKNIKILQQKLNQVLQSVYHPKPSVHGFVEGKSVKTNAQQHVERRWVFNVDLKDFFPCINFGRVRGMFMARPYGLPEKVATVIAHLCCFQGVLPQGAPTSPVVSNMICAKMDSQLQELARMSRSTYTRYSDDITFSTTRWKFPNTIVMLNEENQVCVGDTLGQVITDNGFCINEEKVWLRGQHRRQVVTGVTVNDFPNLPRGFTNQIRAMLHAWSRHKLVAAENEWNTKYSAVVSAPWGQQPSFAQVLKGKIEYLGMIKGRESLTYLKFLDQLRDLDPNLAGTLGTPLRLLLKTYEELKAESLTPQARGYQLEKILNSLFNISKIPVKDSFKRNKGGEQIDGAFEFGNWYYLVECKWRKKLSDIRDVDGLHGKLERSGLQTMGVFISVNGWSSHVVDLLKQNKLKNVLLVDGVDIQTVLQGGIPLNDLLKAKIDALNLKSEPFISVKDILRNKQS